MTHEKCLWCGMYCVTFGVACGFTFGVACGVWHLTLCAAFGVACGVWHMAWHVGCAIRHAFGVWYLAWHVVCGIRRSTWSGVLCLSFGVRYLAWYMVCSMWCGMWNVAFGVACSMHLIYGIWHSI